MNITILICAIVLILAFILVLWQAKALAKCELVCVFCGTAQYFPWKRLLFRQHVGNDWWLACPVCGRKTWFTVQKREQER